MLDVRDIKFVPEAHLVASPPASVDLRLKDWAVWNQGHFNSCTAHAIAGAYELLMHKEKLHAPFDPARMFIYCNELAIEGHAGKNDVVYMRNGMKAVAKHGVCHDELCPYTKESFNEGPSEEAYAHGAEHRTTQYRAVDPDVAHMKACIADGYAFTIGINEYPSYANPAVEKNGEIPVPDLTWEPRIGGHALLVVGYDDTHPTYFTVQQDPRSEKGAFLVRNSMGSGWGDVGYGWLPYDFAKNPDLADSQWTIRYVQ